MDCVICFTPKERTTKGKGCYFFDEVAVFNQMAILHRKLDFNAGQFYLDFTLHFH